MISYKVLITLTVIYIISCSGDHKKACIGTLKRFGFSDKNGFINYCIVKQFAIPEKNENSEQDSNTVAIQKKKKTYENFKLHLNEEKYRNAELYDRDFLESFAKPNIEKHGGLADGLLEPKSFCRNYLKKKKISFISTIKRSLSGAQAVVDSQDVDDCENDIISVNDDNEIVKIDENNKIQTINYGKNQYKNAIKTYSLHLRSKLNRIQSREGWKSYKCRYYKSQKTLIGDKKKKWAHWYSTVTNWCNKYAEAIKNKTPIVYENETTNVETDDSVKASEASDASEASEPPAASNE